MPAMNWRPHRFTVISFALLLLDQAFDLVVEFALPEGASRLFILGRMGITRPVSPGSAMLDTASFFVVLTIIGVPFLWWYKRHIVPDALYRTAVAVFLGGLLGNLADGWRVGHPVDYLRAGVPFNLADVALVMGAVLLFYRMLRPLRGLQGG